MTEAGLLREMNNLKRKRREESEEKRKIRDRKRQKKNEQRVEEVRKWLKKIEEEGNPPGPKEKWLPIYVKKNIFYPFDDTPSRQVVNTDFFPPSFRSPSPFAMRDSSSFPRGGFSLAPPDPIPVTRPPEKPVKREFIPGFAVPYDTEFERLMNSSGDLCERCERELYNPPGRRCLLCQRHLRGQRQLRGQRHLLD
jgi:hypothetical protein